MAKSHDAGTAYGSFANITGHLGSAAWNQPAGSHYYGGHNLNVVWQDTTSNATYCSAASALSAS